MPVHEHTLAIWVIGTDGAAILFSTIGPATAEVVPMNALPIINTVAEIIRMISSYQHNAY